jgi:hypothetical protein
VYNSKSGEYLSEAEKRNRQQHRDRVALRQQHRKRKDEAKEEDSWEQFKLLNNGDEDGTEA